MVCIGFEGSGGGMLVRITVGIKIQVLVERCVCYKSVRVVYIYI